MPINEFIAETIVNKIAALINREIIIADLFGTVLSSTDLSKTGLQYSQMQQAAEGNLTIEVNIDEASFTKNPLGNGVIVPLVYNGEVVASLYVQDDKESYQKYLSVIKTTAELLIYQTLVIDNVPYKDKIKDNFIFGLLHHKLSWDDQRTYDEAELLEVSLHKDKIVPVIYVPGFWQMQFSGETPTSEDERQGRLHSYKKKLYDAIKEFYGEVAGVQISYFGNDTFVALIDETSTLKGNQMIDLMRKKAADFNALVHRQFPKEVEKVAIGLGNFYRGKDGIVLAYEEAKVSLQLGLSFEEHKPLFHIDDLGMIAILAGGNKRWQENFVRNLLTQLLPEKYLIETVEVFFNENMSLTQTAKNLNIHRNTLLYRLSKIKKITGLDPRNFNDAVKLKLASILSSLQEKERV
jgi:carbohydrate diacid regulator